MPHSLVRRLVQALLVRLDQAPLLGWADAGEGVVRRVAEDHEDRLVALDLASAASRSSSSSGKTDQLLSLPLPLPLVAPSRSARW